MTRHRNGGFLAVFIASLATLTPSAARADGPRFSVTVSPKAAAAPVSGRLILFAHPKNTGHGEPWDPETRLAAVEITNLEPGKTRIFRAADFESYPQPFDALASGTWNFFALLDADHSYPYGGEGDGDLVSATVSVPAFDPKAGPVVTLTLGERVSAPDPVSSDRVKVFSVESRVLSAFWKKPVFVRSAVVAPKNAAPGLPVVYLIGGYGATLRNGFERAGMLAAALDEGLAPAMIYVVLDPSIPTGHHVFADSANNGPWGEALTTEFVPALEKAYAACGKPEGRFLTGHSSGGWSTLWLQVRYPDFFGGTWSTSPDSVDFRLFTGIDLTRERSNAYRGPDGKPVILYREQGKDVGTFEDFTRREGIVGPVGGQMASFEWVFSPRGADGRPRKIFDRESGAVDPEVAKAWEPYDILKKMDREWATLGAKLNGKLHVAVGDEDSFRLDESTHALFEFLRPKIHAGHFDARLETHAVKNHFDLYGFGQPLLFRFLREMELTFRRSVKAAAAKAA